MEQNIIDFSKDKSFGFYKPRIHRDITVYINTQYQQPVYALLRVTIAI